VSDEATQQAAAGRGGAMAAESPSRKRPPRLEAVFESATTTVIAQLTDDPLHADHERMLESGERRMSASACLAMGLAVAMLSASSGDVAAQDPVAAAESAAEAAAATPEGKRYEDVVATAFGRDQGKSIQGCAREVKRPDLSDFRVFVRIGAAGQVEEALVKPSTNIGACLQGKLKAWKVGAPPQAVQWVCVHVKLKSK
jgi:hypothetical protein